VAPPYHAGWRLQDRLAVCAAAFDSSPANPAALDSRTLVALALATIARFATCAWVAAVFATVALLATAAAAACRRREDVDDS